MRFLSLGGVVFGLCLLFQTGIFFFIPALGSSVFLSPDETAVAVSARSFALQGHMRIMDPILRDAPWLHPRSFVTQANAMVPVGFLGLSVILGLLFRVFGENILMMFTPLFVLSASYPLWKFSSSFGAWGQKAVIVSWLSLPPVILYANRGLFPNLPLVCLAVWGAYLLWSGQSRWSLIVSGICFGLAFAIRPIEFFWLLPWMLTAFFLRNAPHSFFERKQAFFFFLLAFLIPLLMVACVTWRTYGVPWAIGYWLRDPVVSLNQASSSTAPVRTWPFGFHPRNVWFNASSYLVGFLGPWTAVVAGAVLIYWRERRSRPLLLLGIWTALVLMFVYGQSLYQDHVGINIVASGNSYLRYLLPLAPFFALSVGGVTEWLLQHTRPIFSGLLVFVLVSLGIWMGTVKDDEGVIPSSREISRYQTIRRAALDQVGAQSIVLSERSDKIFFPTFRVATPLPAMNQIHSLIDQSHVPVLLFSSRLDEKGEMSWNEAGIRLRPLFQTENQVLYGLFTSSSTSVL